MDYKFKPGYGEQEGICKARFLAKGFSQIPEQDYVEGEIYSPVVKHDSLKHEFLYQSPLRST
jgi:hypothetical protein